MPFEDWDEDHSFFSKFSRRTILVLAVIAFIIVPMVAYGVIKITSPTSDQLTQNVTPTLSKPSLNTTIAYNGDTVQITTQLSDHASGLQVFFYENSQNIGSAYTDDTGTAIYNRVLPGVTQQTTRIYYADCVHP